MNRIEKLQKEITRRKLGAVLIVQPQSVRYLCNYVGTNGRLLVTPKNATLITDFRYLRSAGKQVPKGVTIFDQKDGLKNLFAKLKTVGFEERHTTVAQMGAFEKAFPGITWKPVSGIVEELRIIKDADEIAIMKRACRMADRCLAGLVKTIKVGVSEDELDWNLLSIARKLGADGFSFPAIICFGKNTADVHHIKEPNKLKKGEAVLIDMGIEYKGYMTDMTRTFYTAKPTTIEHKIYSTVLEANCKAIAAIKVGMTTGQIDKIARDHIEKAGYGKYFGHSTGHGVGLEVHEAPTVSSKSDEIIRPGMVFTVEPGIYLNDVGGVRIEDMVYVNEKGGVEILTKSDKKLRIL